MTTAHQLASLTFSCMKQPVNPESGLPMSKTDRDNLSFSYVKEKSTMKKAPERSVNFETSAANSSVDLSGLSDDKLLEKIVSLKEEHKKTLELCENLYNQKRIQLMGESNNDLEDNKGFANVRVSKEFKLLPESMHSTSEPKFSRTRDRVKDMSLPPPGYSRSTEKRVRASKEQASRMNDSSMSVKSTVSSMWENFSVDDYDFKKSASGGRLDRSKSASLSRIQSKTQKDAENEHSKWINRITIPKPFSMTLRQETKGKSERVKKVLQEVERERDSAKQREEIELDKKFKAKPVPAHVYMPLYDDLLQKTELRRMQTKLKAQELLKSQEKPFKFATREEERKRTKAAKLRKSANGYSESGSFKAKPYPKNLFDGSVFAMKEEQDEYRRIRKEIRAQELYCTSSLPPNMASRQEKLKQKRSGGSIKSCPNFTPKTNDGMPDFDEIHRSAMRQSSSHSQKVRKENTVCKPFNLRTTNIDTKHKVYEDIARDEVVLKETRWPFASSRMRPASAPRTFSSRKLNSLRNPKYPFYLI